MMKYDEVKNMIEESFVRLSGDFKKIYDSLTESQQITIWALWDNGFFLDKEYEERFDEIIIDPRDNK